MNVVDSSGWLEYFADAENAAFFESAIEDVDHLVVPSINLYEVFKRICEQRGEGVALQAVAQMQQGHVVELTSALALSAARLSMNPDYSSRKHKMSKRARHVESDQRVTGYPQKTVWDPTWVKRYICFQRRV